MSSTAQSVVHIMRAIRNVTTAKNGIPRTGCSPLKQTEGATITTAQKNVRIEKGLHAVKLVVTLET